MGERWMDPQIQYAKAGDGVSIAFSTLGEGRPFVEMPPIPLSYSADARELIPAKW
jgi:hypothetical protein